MLNKNNVIPYLYKEKKMATPTPGTIHHSQVNDYNIN